MERRLIGSIFCIIITSLSLTTLSQANVLEVDENTESKYELKPYNQRSLSLTSVGTSSKNWYDNILVGEEVLTGYSLEVTLSVVKFL